jgi:CheY-like chemotaxis protein/two-component sensor histidine kinase
MVVDVAPDIGAQDSGLAAAGRDTELLRQQLDHVKGAFLASLNHEIRTPLSGIVGMLDLLQETSLDEDQRDYLSAARLCTESLLELLNASLEYSALEAGQFRLDESEFSLKEMLDAAIAQQQPKADLKHLKLFLTLDPNLPVTMIGDAPRLRELLGHLIGNAIKFTHNGTVEVRVAVKRDPGEQDRLVAAVNDTGIGIPPDKLGGIFDSFRQADTGLSRSYPGLGLGLALARKLVTVMGGGILVESQLGVGSTFTIDIPLRRPVVPSPDPAPAESGPMILAVEDNPVGMTVLRHILQRRGMKVDCASSGYEALEAATRRRYDLILMDLQMPGMNGLEASLEIRKLPGYDTVPILALTANCADQVREQCRAHGMQAFLSKPVDANELWSTVSEYLKRETPR